MSEAENLKLEVVKLKGEFNLAIMAMGKIDDNLTSFGQLLKEQNKDINHINIAVTKLEGLEARVSKVEEKIDSIEDIPNQILKKIVMAFAGALGIGLASYFSLK